MLIYYSRTTAKGVCCYSYLSSSYGQCRSKLMHYTPVSLSSPITDSVTQIDNHLFSVYRQPVLRKAVNLRVSLKSFNPSGGGKLKHIFTWLMIVKENLNYACENVKSHDENTSFTHNSIYCTNYFIPICGVRRFDFLKYRTNYFIPICGFRRFDFLKFI